MCPRGQEFLYDERNLASLSGAIMDECWGRAIVTGLGSTQRANKRPTKPVQVQGNTRIQTRIIGDSRELFAASRRKWHPASKQTRRFSVSCCPGFRLAWITFTPRIFDSQSTTDVKSRVKKYSHAPPAIIQRTTPSKHFNILDCNNTGVLSHEGSPAGCF